MRNVLIPTDFTPASLQLAERAVESLEGQKVQIILFHAFEIPFFVPDLVGATRRQPYHELLTDEFRQACRQLKNQYPKSIARVVFKFMHGNTRAVFRNFADANEVDVIVYPDYYQYRKVHERSVNPASLFAKSGIPILAELKPVRKEVVTLNEVVPATQLAVN